MKFLARCLSTSTIPPAGPQLKPLSEALASLLEDSFEGARNEAANCLGILMKMIGERPLNSIMDQLAEVRKVKVKEAYEKATVKCKGSSAPAPRGPPTKASVKQGSPAAKAPLATSGGDDALLDDIAPPKQRAKPPARLVAKKAPVEDAGSLESPPSLADPPKTAAKAPARLMVRLAITLV